MNDNQVRVMNGKARGFDSMKRRNPEENRHGLQEFLARSCYCEFHHSEKDELSHLVAGSSSKCKSEMDLALDELLSDFHSYQPPPSLRELSGPKSTSLLDSLSPPPLPKSPFKDEHDIILPPPPDFQDEDPSGGPSSLLLQALTPPPKSVAAIKSSSSKSTTDLLINEINELSELLPPSFIENKAVLAPSNPCSPLGARQRSHHFPPARHKTPHSRICIISKRDETPETDSGIESIESLSPKEFDFSPACSPAGGAKGIPQSNSSSPYFTSSSALLSTEATHHSPGAILSSLLHSTSVTSPSTSELLFSMSEPSNSASPHETIPTFLQSSDIIFDSLETRGGTSSSASSSSSWTGEPEAQRKKKTTEERFPPNSSVTPQLPLLPLGSDLSSWEPKELKCDYSSSSPSQRGASIPRRMNNSKDFYCLKCKMSLGTKTKYERHMRSHGRSKEFKCESCGKEFMIKKNLTLHYKLHAEQKEFPCSVCLKSYQSKSALSAHVKLMHSSEEELFGGCSKGFYESEECATGSLQEDGSSSSSKGFGRRNSVLNPCDKCNKSFKTKKTLLKHIEKASCIPSESNSSWIPPPVPSDPTPEDHHNLLRTIHSMELDELLF